MTPKQRENVHTPTGPWVERVHKNRERLLKEMFEEREVALREAGRV